MTVDKSKMPVGSSILSIELSSDVEIDIKGVYWESTNKWDNIN
jgi:hypothetical protein